MDWYPWFPLSFKRKTYTLSLAEDGAYRRLIDEYMMNREALPDDDAALARILGVAPAEWVAVAPRVRPYFKSQDGLLVHKRCEQELRAQDIRKARHSVRGQKAAIARWSKNNGLHAKRMHASNTLQYKERKIEADQEEKPKAQTGLSASPDLEASVRRRWSA